MNHPLNCTIENEELENLELRSEEVQEIIGATPSRILRYGSVSLMFFIICLLTGSYFFKYPDTICGKFYISSSNPPVYLKVWQNSRIEKLLFNDGDTVLQDDVIASIENTANYNDVLLLENWLSDSFSLDDPLECLLKLKLGELQDNYAEWQKQLKVYFDFLSQDFQSKEFVTQEERKSYYKKYLNSLREKLQLKNRENRLIHTEYKRDSLLFLQGVIASSDLSKAEQNYVQSSQSEKDLSAQITAIELELNNLETASIELRKACYEKKRDYIYAIEENREKLLAAIAVWKKQNLLTSPIKGIVSLAAIWEENQLVVTGQTVCTIVPLKKNSTIGKLILPIQNAGKIKLGQQVNLKFTNYPYREYGMIITNLTQISVVPDSIYIASVDLPDTLITNYGIQIPFSQNLQGASEIITESRSLLERIVLPIKAVAKERM